MVRCIVAGILLAGCSDLSGSWSGDCEYEGQNGRDREVRVVLELEGPDGKGIGTGSGKIIEDGETTRADVVYATTNDVRIAIDVYPLASDGKDGRPLFLRGQRTELSRGGDGMKGACGDDGPLVVDVEGVANCFLDLDAECDDRGTWKPDGRAPAPITADVLEGSFSLKAKN